MFKHTLCPAGCDDFQNPHHHRGTDPQRHSKQRRFSPPCLGGENRTASHFPERAPAVSKVVVFALATALLYLLGLSPALAAPQAATRDPQALSLISSSLQALTGTTTVTDVILQTTATYVARSDQETGTATLTASGNQLSLVQLNLSGGTRQTIRNGPAGTWTGPDGTVHAMMTNNCWTDASWFFPILTLEAAATNPQVSLSYLGPDTSKGTTLLHVRVASVLPEPDATVTALITSLSTMDIYFDPQSFLPMVLDFSVQPDTGVAVGIPIEIRFGNFQSMSGVLVPFQIQKYLQNSLLLDFVVTSATINSGVPTSAFTLPPTTTGGAQ